MAPRKPIPKPAPEAPTDPFASFHPVTAAWFREVFEEPTAPQRLGWPAIARGESTLILAPTGTGKTLTAFLWCLDRLMLQQRPAGPGCRIVYVSPLKALAVDVERNLRSPLAGIANMARRMGVPVHDPEISIRTGDTTQKDRARFRRTPSEILITTPESLYLLLTSQSAESLHTVDTVIIDEIHALVPTKRGAHLALSLERLQALTRRNIQRIGLSATQRPLEEVARFLGGVEVPATETKNPDALKGRGFSRATSEPENAGFSPRGNDSKADSPDELILSQEILSSETESWSADIIEISNLHYRPVTIVNASAPKQLKLCIEVPVEDMARLGQQEEIPSGPASQTPKRVSIWNAIHPRLLEIIRERTSTILFVNSRQVAERLAGALNELAGEDIVRAHHGSIAAPQRLIIEEQLKAGKLRGLCATSTLELGIDMGAVDLVIQIESPPSVASGMQRIGRAGHSVGAVSEGVIFPKYRADLVACAAMTHAMHEAHIESTRFPRNPLDVLAQQIVAIVAHPPNLPPPEKTTRKRTLKPKSRASTRKPLFAEFEGQNGEEFEAKTSQDFIPEQATEVSFDDLFRIVRSAAPFGGLTRSTFESVLDLLSGRYPSDEFAELRPRLTWDRVRNVLSARQGATRLAILNAGTIPDRGLYGVFLSNSEGKSLRVGELDEEMVFESREGETFILGATTWRIDEITHDRVLVSPAPGEPGKMPFWKGDGPGRPLEFGRRIGAMVRELRAMPLPAALTRLVTAHDLDPGAAENLMRFLADQHEATGQVSDDRNIVIERCRDELGDWRVCVLTPFGSRIHIPWAMAVAARIRAAGGPDVETLWGDDGFVLRFPDSDEPPTSDWFMVESAEAMSLVLRQLGATALFAGRFREAAGRALLLPRRRADGRAPLWQQRKRAYDLLSVASRYPGFPLLLETYRECLRDVFDMPALIETLCAIEQRQLRVHVVDTRTPSPFASSLLFSYAANFLYDGDAPLAERRAQALTIDQDQLRELLGEADLRELLDGDAMAEIEEQQQCLVDPYRARSADGLHDLLLRLGDLTREELALRVTGPEVLESLDRLIRTRRLLEVRIAGEKRLIAIEDCARYRDGLGIPLPPGIPAALLEPVAQPVIELVRRYARTHCPFTLEEVARRFALDPAQAELALNHLATENRIVEGGFRPGGLHREWCDAEILRLIRRKSLAKLRKEVEPVEQQTLARFLTHWQGLLIPRRGMDALLDAIENLQGAPLPASLIETAILPARIANYQAGDLDTLIAAGEISWSGVEPLGERDGRVALYLADKMPLLAVPHPSNTILSEREEQLLASLQKSGASFFTQLHESVGGGYPGESLDALWSLVWRGLVTNDSLHPLRAYVTRPESVRNNRKQHQNGTFRSRRTVPATAQGRWSIIESQARVTQVSTLRPGISPSTTASESTPNSRSPKGTGFSPYVKEPRSDGALAPEANLPTTTESTHALALQLLNRYGVLLRECAAAENIPGGFSAIYPVLKALEESGRIRRGYFVAGLGATQFALPAAIDLLRSLRSTPQLPEGTKPEFVLLAATDPANPYGSTLKWPELPPESEDTESAPRILTRAAYAQVVLCAGRLVAWLRRGNPNLLVFLPADEPERSQIAEGLARFLAELGQSRLQQDQSSSHHSGYLISTINGLPVAAHPIARALQEAGFHPGPLGMHLRRPTNLPPRPATQGLQPNRLSPEQAAMNRPALTRPD
ncbi:Lhr family helicase [Acidicapsa acidisoli]|uniref:Lhr family helicase n=1 Tax=Acidicapsa acidisoli TaxID=1615681 RepID=UPI0021DF4C9A|nr:DEAD/DEAH box helicase [Acidicapsa acidisoli]